MSTLETNLRRTGASLLGFDEHLTGFRHISSTFVRKGSLKADSRVKYKSQSNSSQVSEIHHMECATWNCFFCALFFVLLLLLATSSFPPEMSFHTIWQKKKKKIFNAQTHFFFFFIFNFF